MATRIEKKIECDDKGCRRRTDVKKYTYTIENTESGGVMYRATAEHCPYHLKLNVRRLQQSTINTKEYPGDTVVD